MSLFLKKDDSSLNKLKFGTSTFYDRPNQGFSSQPYVQKEINDENTFLPTDKDFLLRGGINLGKSIIDDEIRLTKQFTDTSTLTGLLFTAKQTLLSRLNVDVDYNKSNFFNQGIFTPASILINAGLSPLGIHSSLFINNFKYDEYHKENKEDSQLLNINDKRLTGELNNNKIIKEYNGGPGSVGGVGKTIIPLSSNNTIDIVNPTINPLDSNNIYTEKVLKTRENIDNKQETETRTIEELYNIYSEFVNDYNLNNNIDNQYDKLSESVVEKEENLTLNILKTNSNYNNTIHTKSDINPKLKNTNFKNKIEEYKNDFNSFTFNNYK